MAHVGVSLLKRLFWIFDHVIFNDEIVDAGFLGVRQDRFEVEHSAPGICDKGKQLYPLLWIAAVSGKANVFRHVFYVHQF